MGVLIRALQLILLSMGLVRLALIVLIAWMLQHVPSVVQGIIYLMEFVIRHAQVQLLYLMISLILVVDVIQLV